MPLGSIYVVVPISSHKEITMKRQNGILSAVFAGSGEMEWERKVGRKKEQNYTPEHRVRKHLSLWPLYHSPIHVTIITTQWAGTKDKPKSGVQRESWPEILCMGIYSFKSFIRPLPSSKDISIIVTILKSIHNGHLKPSHEWERCDLLVLAYWPSLDFLKYFPTLKVDFTKWSGYNSFLFWASVWYISIYNILFKMGKCHWDDQQDSDLEVVGQEGCRLSLNVFFHPLLCVHDILQVPWKSLQLFPKIDTLNRNIPKSFWGKCCIVNVLCLCILGWVVPPNKYLNNIDGMDTFIKSRNSHTLTAGGSN